MKVLNIESALEMTGEDAELLCELMDSFINDKNFSKSHLDKLIAEGKNEDAAGYVHFFKGAARQLAAEKMAASGQILEDVLHGKKEGSVEELAETYAMDYTEALSAIKEAKEKLISRIS